MDPTGKLLIIWHSRTGASEAMAHAALQGSGQNAVLIKAEATSHEHLLAAGGYLFVCPENLATMSGLMKEMFDRCYYPVLGKVEGRPYATAIAAGSDGEGALRQIDRIATGWRLKRVADPVIVNMVAQTPEEIMAPKLLSVEQAARCKELGQAMSAGIEMGIF